MYFFPLLLSCYFLSCYFFHVTFFPFTATLWLFPCYFFTLPPTNLFYVNTSIETKTLAAQPAVLTNKTYTYGSDLGKWQMTVLRAVTCHPHNTWQGRVSQPWLKGATWLFSLCLAQIMFYTNSYRPQYPEDQKKLKVERIPQFSARYHDSSACYVEVLYILCILRLTKVCLLS